MWCEAIAASIFITDPAFTVAASTAGSSTQQVSVTSGFQSFKSRFYCLFRYEIRPLPRKYYRDYITQNFAISKVSSSFAKEHSESQGLKSLSVRKGCGCLFGWREMLCPVEAVQPELNIKALYIWGSHSRMEWTIMIDCSPESSETSIPSTFFFSLEASVFFSPLFLFFYHSSTHHQASLIRLTRQLRFPISSSWQFPRMLTRILHTRICT